MKKFCILVLCLISVIFLRENQVVADEIMAEDLTSSNSVVVSDGQNGSVLSDSNRFSKLTVNSGTTITISNEIDFSSIYVIWDKPVGEWTLNTQNTDYIYGKYGFIHEYIELPSATNELTITIPCDDAIICEVYTFSSGETPEWVQKWKPPYQRADMLLFSTHGDDEFIFFGGTIPYYAGELGLKVQVVYVTSHWGESYRPHEQLNALWASGMEAYPIIGDFPDNCYLDSFEVAKSVYDYQEMVEFTVEQIRRFKPMVIVGHDLNGEYGHGAHIIAAHTLVDALEVSADSAVLPDIAEKYGVWDVPKTYLHLYEKNKVQMNWDIPLEHFNGKTAFEMAEYAFSFYKSQLKYNSISRETGKVYDCHAFGLYRTTVGNDTGKNDFMENIELYKEPVPEPEPEESSLVDDSLNDSSSVNDSESVVDAVSNEVNDTKTFKIVFISLVCAFAIIAFIINNKLKKNSLNKKIR